MICRPKSEVDGLPIYMTLLLIGNLSISLATRNGFVPVLPSALRASSRSGRAAVSSTWWSGLCVGRSGRGARPTTGTDRPTRPVSPAPRTGQSARSPRPPAPVSPPGLPGPPRRSVGPADGPSAKGRRAQGHPLPK